MTARRKHPKIELRHEEMEKSQHLSVSQTETYDQVDFICAGIQVVIRNLRRPEWPNIITADDKA